MIILIQIKRITHGSGSVPTAKAREEEDGRDGFYWILVKHTPLEGTAGQEHAPPIPRTGCRISSPLTFPARHLLYPINRMRAPGKTIGHPPAIQYSCISADAAHVGLSTRLVIATDHSSPIQ